MVERLHGELFFAGVRATWTGRGGMAVQGANAAPKEAQATSGGAQVEDCDCEVKKISSPGVAQKTLWRASLRNA